MLPVGIAEVRLQGCISFTHALLNSGPKLRVSVVIEYLEGECSLMFSEDELRRLIEC
jgi:hypothetical protein